MATPTTPTVTGFVAGLNATQLANIEIIKARFKARGFKNAFTLAAILAVSSKESKFIPQSEASYRNTSNARIRQVFPTKLKSASDASINTLKAIDEAFFNFVYGGMYGNAANEGYKFRGRGYNQLTFKGNYQSIGKKIGKDLVSNPDLVNDPNVAADVMIQYFIDAFEVAKTKGYLAKYNTTGLDNFTTQEDALNAVFQANRGWTKTGPDTTGGYALAKERVGSFYTFVSDNKGTIGGTAFF